MEPRRAPQCRTWLAATVVLVGLAVGLPTGSRASAVTSGTIEIRVQAAPDVIGGVTPRLMLDGTDVTADYCTTSNDGTYDWLNCVGLPNGTYDVEVDGVPGGARTTVNCEDLVADRALRPLIDVGRFTEWSCTAYVGTPAVLLGVGIGYDPPPPPGISLSLAPVAGVTPDCIEDVMYGDEPVTRCRNLVPGTYHFEISGVPPGQIATLYCASEFFAPDEEASYGLSYTVGPSPVVDDDFWLWFCNLSTPEPNAVLVLSLPRDAVDDIAVDVTPTLTGPDGLPGDLATVCPTTRDFDFESGLKQLFELHCALVDSGEYQLVWEGVPDGIEFDEECGTFAIVDEPDAAVFCETHAAIDDIPLATVPAGQPTATEPAGQPVGPGPTLPDTGRSTAATLAIAAIALVGGALLVLLTRRRLEHPTGS